MLNPQDNPTRTRALQCVAIVSALALVHCADPAVAPRIPDLDDVALNVNAHWTPTVLPLPKSVTESFGNDVNNAGVVVGVVTVQGENGPRAVRWVNGVMSFLTEPKGTDPATVVERINNSGISVGNYHPGSGENKAVRWDAAGNPTVLAGLPGGSSDWAFDVNDKGVIVGQSQHHAVRWVNGVVQDLHPPGYGKSRATGINTAGDIVGWVEYVTGEHRAYLWRANDLQQELGVLGGDTHSEAMAINDALIAVGNSGDLISFSQAFRWTNPLGIANANLGAPNTYATANSNFDRTVGYRRFLVNGQLRYIALTRHGGLVDVLPNPLRYNAWARGVNLCGDVVGTGETVSGISRAVLWKNTACDP